MLNADVPGVTWHRNKIYIQIFLGDYFHNSQHSRNYVSICASLFKAHSDDIKEFSPLAIQEVIFNRDFLNKTKLEYLHGDEDKKSHL